MSVRTFSTTRTPGRRFVLLLFMLAMAVTVGVLAGAGGSVLRARTRPQVTVAEARTSATTAGALEVPRSAVVVDGGHQVVFVIVNGVVIRQPVDAVAATPVIDVVTSGLSPHAIVVTSPVGLHDGDKVRTP